MENHASTFMDVKLCINRCVRRRRRIKQEGKAKWRKGEKGKGEKKEKKKKRGRRPTVSSSVHRRLDGRNSLDQGVKSQDSTRGYASRGRDFSYFGLFLTFGLLFWADFGMVLCHVNGMGWVCSRFKGLLSEKICVEKISFTGVAKLLQQPSACYYVDWRNCVALGVFQLQTTISFLSELRFGCS